MAAGAGSPAGSLLEMRGPKFSRDEAGLRLTSRQVQGPQVSLRPRGLGHTEERSR